MVVRIVVSILLSVFSTAVMSYISMATPIGPWIAPTLVLFSMIIFNFLRDKSCVPEYIGLAVSASSIGGILATAIGFSFPTLYFLDYALFNQWLVNPLYFIGTLGGLSLVSGLLALWMADYLEQKLIVEEHLSFPIGQLVHKMIGAQQQVRKAWELVAGFVSTLVFCMLQDGFWIIKSIIPKSLMLRQAGSWNLPWGATSITFPALQFDLWPTLWAIGFVTGHVIAFPLAIGALSKMCIVDPINSAFFSYIPSVEFILAFCSGMVLSSFIVSFIGVPKMVIQMLTSGRQRLKDFHLRTVLNALYTLETMLLFSLLIVFFTYFGFSLSAQVYLVVFTAICVYQIVVIAGNIGLAQLGRFATFVMVPAMFLFNLNLVQIVLVGTFVELCGGIAADILFNRKMARLTGISLQKIKRYQFFGIIISSLVVGIIFWLLIRKFGLGSSMLFAQRAQARALLITIKSFNYVVLLFGCAFGFLLKVISSELKKVPSLRVIDVNPMMVLSGVLMPLNVSLGLIFGGVVALFTKNKEEYYPFWSGVFASNSIWIIIKAIF